MFFQLKQYLSFLIKSTNQHGVHSPFIYDLTINCLRKKPASNRLKKVRKKFQKNSKNRSISLKKEILLINITSYFNPDKALEILNFSKKSSKEDLINNFNLSLKNIHNDSVLILNNIHSNIETNNAWKTIKQHPKVTVTIDTYYLGLIFFRKEQEKEHFIIRV